MIIAIVLVREAIDPTDTEGIQTSVGTTRRPAVTTAAALIGRTGSHDGHDERAGRSVPSDCTIRYAKVYIYGV